MSERTVLVTTDRHRYALIEHVRDDLREQAIEVGLGTLEQILDVYDRRTRKPNARQDIDEQYEAYRANQPEEPPDASMEQVIRSANRRARP